MNIRSSILAIFGRLRLPGAFLCALAALPMIWTGLGFSPLQVLPGKALAEAVRSDGREAALAVMSEERVRLLQASVDSVALGLGGALSPLGDEAAKRRTLAGALSALTAYLGADIYFTAWQGTRILHSPSNLDADGLDFAAALDGRGAPFVLGMERLGREQGGFLRVLLPPQRRSPVADQAPGQIQSQVQVQGQVQGQNSGPVHEPLPGQVANPVWSPARALGPGSEKERDALLPSVPALCPPDKGGCALGHEAAGFGANVEQVVYVRGIPDSGWHIAAFLPVPEQGERWRRSAAPDETSAPDEADAPGVAGLTEALDAPGMTGVLALNEASAPTNEALAADAPGMPGVTGPFSSVWQREDLALSMRQERFLKGLRISGFSLAGLAGLLLLPVARGASGGRQKGEEGADV